jgi:hypothetical protein
MNLMESTLPVQYDDSAMATVSGVKLRSTGGLLLGR